MLVNYTAKLTTPLSTLSVSVSLLSGGTTPGQSIK